MMRIGEILSIQEKLNHRPRKVLNYRTPYEVFFEELLKEMAAYYSTN